MRFVKSYDLMNHLCKQCLCCDIDLKRGKFRNSNFTSKIKTVHFLQIKNQILNFKINNYVHSRISHFYSKDKRHITSNNKVYTLSIHYHLDVFSIRSRKYLHCCQSTF